MKATLITIAMVCIILLEQGFSQVTGVKYLLKYNTTSCRFDACIVITAGSATTAPQRAQFNSQYSLVVPTGSSLSIAQNFNPIQGNQGGTLTTPPLVWVVSSSVIAPAAAPSLDFYSITPTLSPTSFYGNLATGDTIRLFSVNITPFPNCGVGIRPFQNGVDPGSSAQGMNGGDFTNGFTIGGTAQDYMGNLPTITPKQPVLSAVAGCSSGININLSVATNACQTTHSYQWSGPAGYNGTSQDVNISPASYATNGGTYQVIVTDNLQCKDTLTIDAFPKPSGGSDVVICDNGQIILTGTNPSTGTWTANPSNPAGAVLGATTNGEATADFANAGDGAYAFYYTAGACSDTVVVNKGNPDAGPDPTPIECFNSGLVNMAATGVGTWSLGAGSAGTVSIGNASDPGTSVSQFSAAGNYYMVWSSGGCTDTVLIVAGSNCSGCTINNNIISQPTTSAFCNNSGPVAINGNAANPAGGIYLWQYSLNGAPFSAASGTNNQEDYTTASLSAGTHVFRRLYTKTTAPVCTDTSDVVNIIVTANPLPPTGLAANPNPVCLGNAVSLSANMIAGSTYTWTASSVNAGLVPSTTNATSMTPVTAATYTVSVTRTESGCTSAAATVNVTAVQTPPTPSDISGIDPTTCGGTNGSIIIGSLSPNTMYTVNYAKNGVPASVSLSTNGSGDLTILNLSSGNYTNFSLASGSCTSGLLAGPITLLNPNAPPAPSGISASDPDICANTTTVVSVTNNPGATYAWASSNPSVLALQAPSTSNSATFIGLIQGAVVVSVTQTLGGCTSPPATIDIQVFGTPSTPSSISGQNPTVCEGTDGSLTISGLPASTPYTLAYKRNGSPVSTPINSNPSGIAIVSGLNAASYTDFQLTNAVNCSSGVFAGPVTLSDPGNTVPLGLRATPNPACLGSTVALTLQNVQGATYNWSASSPDAGLGMSTSNTATMIPTAPGSYTINVTQTVAGCVSPPAQITVLVRSDCYNPDFGVTYQEIELTGDLGTNDDAASGTEYGNMLASPSNPSGCVPVIALDGTYTFTCADLGEYNFTVQACFRDICVNVPLSITVLEQESQTNPPVAHHDYVATKQNTPVTINILANDKCESTPNCTLDAPTVVTPPANGSFNAVSGLYTPSNGFTGRDSVKYRVCQTPATPPVSCDEEWVYIYVYPAVASNFTNAMDDYAQTTLNTNLIVNAANGLKANDVDVEGNSTSINPQNKSIPGKGSLSLLADGSYTFTPEVDFIGPVDFPYEVCDNGNPSACDSATLHILVLSSLPSGSLGDFVWFDQNGNGIQNAGEAGLANVEVRLYNASGLMMSSTVTAPNGAYLFNNVIPGDYYLEYITPAGYQVTLSQVGSGNTDNDITGSYGDGTTNLITLSAGENNLSIDAGFYVCSKIGNIVWYDVNKNDKWETTENGINGLQVNLWRNVNGSWLLWDTQITGHKPNTPSDDGWYEFCTVPGTYYVQVILPPNNKLVAVKPFVGGNPFRDSDITNANGPVTTNSFNLSAGQNKLDIGAGFYPMAIAGNLIWLDANMNGLQDESEPKLSGVLVQAYEAGTNMLYGQAVSDAEGKYKIEYLPKTDMYYKFTPPAGLNATYPNMGADNINSDVDHSNGLNTTRVFSMQSGVYNENIDMGLALGALPVTWVSVDAQKVKEGHKVSWSTANEVNLAYYEVQTFLPNDKQFSTISDKIYPGEGSEVIKKYQFVNENADGNGWFHYRIKQVDFDGSESYSDKVSLLNESDSRLSLYPNPAINRVEVGFDLESESGIEIFVYNIKGDLLSKLSYNGQFERGSHSVPFDISDLPSGAYTFNIKINGNVTSKIVIKE